VAVLLISPSSRSLLAERDLLYSRTPTPTAVSELPYTGAEIAEWLFNQEKATLENAEKCAGIVKPL